jgi:hypothetical protein
MVLFSLIERAAQELACVRDSSFAISIPKMKARQSRKILEIGEALVATGLPSLDAQAEALGLPRSTTYTIVSAEHKSTGISAAIICRMLNSPRLPSLVRAKIIEYAAEKAAGLYGGTKVQRRRFISALKSNDAGLWLSLRSVATATSPTDDQGDLLDKSHPVQEKYRMNKRDAA